MCDGFIHPCESIALAKGAGLEVKDGQEDTGERDNSGKATANSESRGAEESWLVLLQNIQ